MKKPVLESAMTTHTADVGLLMEANASHDQEHVFVKFYRFNVAGYFVLASVHVPNCL
jgi:hypothetical protein